MNTRVKKISVKSIDGPFGRVMCIEYLFFIHICLPNKIDSFCFFEMILQSRTSGVQRNTRRDKPTNKNILSTPFSTFGVKFTY